MTGPPRDATVIAEGFAFPECPRWRDHRLWFADMHVGAVFSLRPDHPGRVEVELQLPGTEARSAGIGFLPDGRLLAVSSLDATVVRRETDGRVVVHADLRDCTRGLCNDMLVDPGGRAYVGSYGADFRAHESATDVCLAFVPAEGNGYAVGEPLSFPNGMVLSPDGGLLLVAESLADRLTAFTVMGDGSLADRRTWSAMPAGSRPDGICLDAEGAVWVASFPIGECVRVHEGGRISDRVRVPDRVPFVRALGGPGGRTLFVCAARTWRAEETLEERAGRIAAVEVDVPAP